MTINEIPTKHIGLEPSLTKKVYNQPKLSIYGEIRQLTKDVVATSGEGASGMGMAL